MFQRRVKLTALQNVRAWLWPRTGWRRAVQYLMHRLARLPASAYAISAGFACGAAISFTPFVGLHFITAAILAWLIRANVLASAIGTFVGNPWTFPFIWVWLYESGNWLLTGGEQATIDASKVDFRARFGDAFNALLHMDIQSMTDSIGPILWPMLISSVPTGLVVWFAVFLPLRKIVASYQHRRRRRLRMRAARWQQTLERDLRSDG